jgi:hypothetical protein
VMSGAKVNSRGISSQPITWISLYLNPSTYYIHALIVFEAAKIVLVSCSCPGAFLRRQANSERRDLSSAGNYPVYPHFLRRHDRLSGL